MSQVPLLGLLNPERVGGWSMHDEACTHYVSMIENTGLGHRFN